jgi:hypothetical protein
MEFLEEFMMRRFRAYVEPTVIPWNSTEGGETVSWPEADFAGPNTVVAPDGFRPPATPAAVILPISTLATREAPERTEAWSALMQTCGVSVDRADFCTNPGTGCFLARNPGPCVNF